MKKLLIAILISTLPVLVSTSSEVEFRDQEKPGTILFKVTSPGSDKVSYLFGTHHAFGKAFFHSLKNANQALLASTVLLEESLEIPGHTATDIINARSNETNWTKYMNKKDLEYLKTVFKDSPTDFRKISPTEMSVFLNRLVTGKSCDTKTSDDNSLSLDQYIASLAEDNGIKTFGLETRERQLEIIEKDVEGMPAKVHKKRLATLIDQLRSGTGDCTEVNLYASMDWEFYLQEPCRNALMLTDRNALWMEQIRGYLKEENCFIAVGLSHLMFECGLINQIRALGYEVTPVAVK